MTRKKFEHFFTNNILWFSKCSNWVITLLKHNFMFCTPIGPLIRTYPQKKWVDYPLWRRSIYSGHTKIYGHLFLKNSKIKGLKPQFGANFGVSSTRKTTMRSTTIFSSSVMYTTTFYIFSPKIRFKTPLLQLASQNERFFLDQSSKSEKIEIVPCILAYKPHKSTSDENNIAGIG